MFYTAILLLLTAAVARGNITGQHPHAGKCLCLSGTGVNARDKREYQSFRKCKENENFHGLH